MAVFSFELLKPILLHYPGRTRMVDLGQWLWESQMPNSLRISSRPASARMTPALDNLRRTRTDSLSRAITLKTSGIRRAPPRMSWRPRPEGYHQENRRDIDLREGDLMEATLVSGES